MANTIDNVDFDFFDTPRNTENVSSRSPGKYLDGKPPPSPTSSLNKHGERPTSGVYRDHVNEDLNRHNENSSDDSYSDSFSSDTDSETPRVEKGKGSESRSKNDQGKGKKKEGKRDSYSESSSAYSNSDYSSDDSFDRGVNNNNNRKKEVIEVSIPKMQVNAWSEDFSKDNNEGEDAYKSGKNRKSDSKREGYNSRKHRSHSDSSESDSSCERMDSRKQVRSHNDRNKDAKRDDSRKKDKNRRPLRSASSSYSNNSDITDVSPLESPENSPRVGRRQYYNNSEKENGQYDDVQYRNPDKDIDIKLETDQIDLSILMKCMADIDKEKQQRLKANTRRVMFAPPTGNERGNQNYTFSMGRAKTIEQENQRLLKQIMHHVGGGGGSGNQKPSGKTKKAVHQEPVVQRMTPSAVNRMREQRRIEMENMQMLNRLQRVRPSPGMARQSQLKEFEKQAAYGIPSGTMIIPGGEARYETMPTKRDLGSSMSTQRSRPSSAKSNISLPGGRRSRPSSAKSNASVISNVSLRSNMSMRSNVSKRSTVSMRSTSRSGKDKNDNRPAWDDRFSFA